MTITETDIANLNTILNDLGFVGTYDRKRLHAIYTRTTASAGKGPIVKEYIAYIKADKFKKRVVSGFKKHYNKQTTLQTS